MIPQNPSNGPAVLPGPRVDLAVVGLERGDRVPLRSPAPRLVVPLEAATARVRVGARGFDLDRGVVLHLPPGARAALGTSAVGSRVAVLAFHEAAFAAVARAHQGLGVDPAALARWRDRLDVLPRTTWVHELVHRYVFERFVLAAHTSAASRFLETEILKELHFLFRDREGGRERGAAVRRHRPEVARALGLVEARLFEPIPVAELAARAGTSEATLRRAFARDVGTSPGRYARDRRLDEALVLLRSGRHPVAAIAARVGYDNPTAFGFAFKRRFGRPPSAFLPRGALQPSP